MSPRNGLNGLTFDQVQAIRSSDATDEYFAAKYGVCKDTIAKARCGRTYKSHPTPVKLRIPEVGKYFTGGRHPTLADVTLLRPPVDLALFERLCLWAEIDDDGCWIWTGSYHSSAEFPSGHHGTFRYQGKTVGAHRVMWIALNGEIPAGLHILHRCDKPKCIKPTDLWAGTHLENMRDSFVKGRHISSPVRLALDQPSFALPERRHPIRRPVLHPAKRKP